MMKMFSNRKKANMQDHIRASRGGNEMSASIGCRERGRLKTLLTILCIGALLFSTATSFATTGETFSEQINIFSPSSTPALEISHLAIFVFSITGAVFIVVTALLLFVIFRYRVRSEDDASEPAQVYGSNQIELAWTVIPVLIVVVLFLATARVLFAIQDAPKPQSALDVTVVGHQFWWEFRYPKLGIVTANELHVPVSGPDHPNPTYLKLMSADVDHSFWVPQLGGKTDLIPNHVNEMWIDPLKPGLYLGQCAQFCGVEHAKMLLRVYVDTPDQFASWIANQHQQGLQDPHVAVGRHVFETQSCMNCHTIEGTAATGRFGPNLTHLMSRSTIGSGIAANNPHNLHDWITNPDHLKKGSLMPAMQLSDDQLDPLVAYLSSLN
jgi:cytochrome c oxidase subunit 2